MNWPLIRHRIFWFGLAAIFGLNALWQCYNLGYDEAKHYYEQREFRLMQKHQDELLEEMKKRIKQGEEK